MRFGDDHELNVCIRLGEFLMGKNWLDLYRLVVVLSLFREDDRMASDIDTLEASD